MTLAAGLGPARLPEELLAHIHGEVVAILRLPEARTVMNAQGAEPTSPEQFSAYIKSEIAKWGKVIRDAKVAIN